MPIYSMQDTNTNEIFEINLKMSEREDYLKENPHIIQIFNKFPGLVDPANCGRKKPDREFDAVLNHIKSSHKHSTIETNY